MAQLPRRNELAIKLLAAQEELETRRATPSRDEFAALVLQVAEAERKFQELTEKSKKCKMKIDASDCRKKLAQNLHELESGTLKFLILAEDELSELEAVCAGLYFIPVTVEGKSRVQVTSRFAVSKDCDIAEEGWDSPDDDDWEFSPGESEEFVSS